MEDHYHACSRHQQVKAHGPGVSGVSDTQ
jgi:hypothetical protein